MIDKSLSIDPKQPYAWNNKGNILRDMNSHIEALYSYERGLKIDNTLFDLNYNRAITLHEMGRIEEALKVYTHIINLRSNDIKSYINRGNIYHELGNSQAAIDDYNAAIKIQPNFALAYSNRGTVYQDMNDIDNAIESYDIALSIEPTAAVYSNRGNIYQSNHKIEESLLDYEEAIKLDPHFPIAYGNKGNALVALRRLDEAAVEYEKALSLEPDFADALWNKSVLLLTLGNYEEGFKLFENRWRSALRKHRRKMDKPLWFGQESLKGKTIFIYPEQGFGDFIQFCRYLPLLDKLDTNVIVEVPAILSNLIKTVNCKATFIDSERLTEIPEHDFQCPIMSLPGAFHTSMKTIPATSPYLYADEIKKQYWAEKIGPKTKMRIGLVWSGGFRPDQPETWATNERRNIKLAKLECFKDIDAEFYSLQKGVPEQELNDLKAANWNGPEIISYTDELIDFADTAALIANLDMVISVDTSTAHVAAAIGKPVWIFNRFDSCWRWLDHRTDSPWYPTIKLFTQPTMNDWEPVIKDILENLKQL